MSKEFTDYRPTLEFISSRYGDKAVLTIKETAAFCGRSDKWVKRHVPRMATGEIAVTTLARFLAGGE